MGLFSNNSTVRAQPDLSRYDYHYRGSHVNGYNVESGSSTTARQYVRQMALNGNNKKVVNTYPQTRRATTIKRKPSVKRNASSVKRQPVYQDEEFDYGNIDFDNHNFSHDEEEDFDGEYPERYNSITSVTTTTTTTTKEVDPITGMETVTKTVEKSLPDGSIETTTVKTQKPGSSRNSSRNNSFVGNKSPQKYADNFNNFSSEHYTLNSSETIPEEEEYEDDNIYHFTSASKRRHPQNRIPKKHINNKDVYSNVEERMSESQMYARALEIAREKVMSDPARLNVQANVTKKKSGFLKKDKGNKGIYSDIGKEDEILQPGLIPGKPKQYSLKKSLRDEPAPVQKEHVYDDSSLMNRSIKSEGTKKENKLKKGFKSLFKKKDAVEPKDETIHHAKEKASKVIPKEEIITEEEYQPLFTTQQNVAGDNLITKSLVDAGSDSEIEFLPFGEEEEEEQPLAKKYSRSENKVVSSDNYVEDRDINKNQVDYISHKSYAADKQLAIESGLSEGDFIDFDDNDGEKEQKEEEDVTELYNDIPDNVIAANHTEIPDSSLLQDVPLLKTIQSENELRDALENIDEDKEVEVMKAITDKNKDEYYIPTENVEIIHDVEQHENTLVAENLKSKTTPKTNPIIDNDITPESEKNADDIDESPLVIENVDQVEIPDGKLDALPQNLGAPVSVTNKEKDRLEESINAPAVSTNEGGDKIKTNIDVPIVDTKGKKEELNQSVHVPVVSTEKHEDRLLKDINAPVAEHETFLPPPIEETTKKTKKTKQSNGILNKIVKFSNENYGVNVTKPSSTESIPEKGVGKTKKKWKLFKKN